MKELIQKYRDSLLQELREELEVEKEYAKRFPDDPNAQWYEEAIEKVSKMNSMAELVEFELEGESEGDPEAILDTLIRFIDEAEEDVDAFRNTLIEAARAEGKALSTCTDYDLEELEEELIELDNYIYELEKAQTIEELNKIKLSKI